MVTKSLLFLMLASCTELDEFLKGGDPTISVVENGNCRTYTFECYGGCATDLDIDEWTSFTSEGEQCGVREGETESSCWPAILSEDERCAYADFYNDSNSKSTCTSVTLTLCNTSATERSANA